MTLNELFSAWEARVTAIGLSLSDVRTEAGVHPANFSNWRNGRGGMTFASIQKVEAAVAALEQRARQGAAGKEAPEARAQGAAAGARRIIWPRCATTSHRRSIVASPSSAKRLMRAISTNSIGSAPNFTRLRPR